MKTNVSIKFNSIEEYREIEKKLIELGYILGKYIECCLDFTPSNVKKQYSLFMHRSYYVELAVNINGDLNHYNSLEEFLKD